MVHWTTWRDSDDQRTICRALSISSHNKRFDAIPVLEAMQFLRTRKESNTPSWIGSIGSPVFRSNPTVFPSACSSWSAATTINLSAGVQSHGTSNSRATYVNLGYHGRHSPPRSLG
jgi:UDP-N-acetylenolpyruvoylglucosamine reductase